MNYEILQKAALIGFRSIASDSTNEWQLQSTYEVIAEQLYAQAMGLTRSGNHKRRVRHVADLIAVKRQCNSV